MPKPILPLVESLRDRFLGPDRHVSFTGQEIGRSLEHLLAEHRDSTPHSVGSTKRAVVGPPCPVCDVMMRQNHQMVTKGIRRRYFICWTCGEKAKTEEPK